MSDMNGAVDRLALAIKDVLSAAAGDQEFRMQTALDRFADSLKADHNVLRKEIAGLRKDVELLLERLDRL